MPPVMTARILFQRAFLSAALQQESNDDGVWDWACFESDFAGTDSKPLSPRIWTDGRPENLTRHDVASPQEPFTHSRVVTNRQRGPSENHQHDHRSEPTSHSGSPLHAHTKFA